MPAVASCLVIEGAVLRGLKENDTARKNFFENTFNGTSYSIIRR